MAMLRMAQPQQHNNDSSLSQQHLVLHDFLGMKPSDASPDVRLSEVTLAAAASSAAARGPFSSTSDTASGEWNSETPFASTFKISAFQFK